MAKNDRNSQKGKLGELRVAEALVTTGCVVNFLSFMDVGLDLHVQIPAGSKMPEPEETAWKMSGQSAHVQVKSTTTTKLPPISRETAVAWNLGAQAGVPTVVVAVVVDSQGGSGFRFFSPLVIKLYADKCRGDSFSIPVSRGEVVEPDELFQRVVLWVSKGRYYLANGVQFRWTRFKVDAWESALEMVAQLTLIHERAFFSPAVSAERQGYTKTVESLMTAFLKGAGLSGDVLYTSRKGQRGTLLAELEQRADSRVRDARTEDAWSEWVEPLASVSPARDELGALNDLSEICQVYGAVSQGRFHLPA